MQKKYTLLISAIRIPCGFSLFSSFETDKTKSFNPIDKKKPKYWIGDEQARRIYFMFPALNMKYQKQENESLPFQKRRP